MVMADLEATREWVAKNPEKRAAKGEELKQRALRTLRLAE